EKSDSWRSALLHIRQLLVRANHVESERKNRAGKCSRGSFTVLPRLLDVGDYFSRATGRTRRAQAIAAKNPLCDARSVAFPRAAAPQVRKDLRRHQRKLSSPRGSGDLPHARPHGATLGDARAAGRWAGQFW